METFLQQNAQLRNGLEQLAQSAQAAGRSEVLPTGAPLAGSTATGIEGTPADDFMFDDEQAQMLAEALGSCEVFADDENKHRQELFKTAIEHTIKGDFAGKLGIRKSIAKAAKTDTKPHCQVCHHLTLIVFLAWQLQYWRGLEHRPNSSQVRRARSLLR